LRRRGVEREFEKGRRCRHLEGVSKVYYQINSRVSLIVKGEREERETND